MPLRAWHSALKVICLGVRNELGSAFISAWVPPQCLVKKNLYLWVENTLWKQRTVFCLWVSPPPPFQWVFMWKILSLCLISTRTTFWFKSSLKRYRPLTLVWNGINGRQKKRKRHRRAPLSRSLCSVLIGLRLKHLWLWERGFAWKCHISFSVIVCGV